MEKFTLLISPATSEYNNKNFCNYDTTINVFIDDIAEDGFLSLQVGNENDTDEFYVNFVKQFYPNISVENTEIIRDI